MKPILTTIVTKSGTILRKAEYEDGEVRYYKGCFDRISEEEYEKLKEETII